MHIGRVGGKLLLISLRTRFLFILALVLVGLLFFVLGIDRAFCKVWSLWLVDDSSQDGATLSKHSFDLHFALLG